MEKLYLDTFVFMDVLSSEPDSAKAREYFERMKKGTKCVVSSILFAELAFHVKRQRGKDKAVEVLLYVSSLPNLEIVPVNQVIAKAAGLMRARHAGKIAKKLSY